MTGTSSAAITSANPARKAASSSSCPLTLMTIGFVVIVFVLVARLTAKTPRSPRMRQVNAVLGETWRALRLGGSQLSSSSQKTHCFGQAEHQVKALDRLTGRAFAQVVGHAGNVQQLVGDGREADRRHVRADDVLE